MRLIDADALLDRLPKCDLDHDEKITRSGAIMDMICMVDTAPTVEVPRWIPVTERLPETMPPVDQEVIVRFAYGQTRGITHAIYHDGTVLTEDSDHTWKGIYEWGNYDEETDCYFIPQGWYETSHFGEYIASINLPVTHWMPMPSMEVE